ncbi:hypothetical protein HDU79_006920 [Rhizoclosmatium sp. JEL0117]|nr:hypothetical protein HDU79_006920 [Rhizoclosmatium sp. JEL0117]
MAGGLVMIDDLFAYYLLDALISSGLEGNTAGTILLVSEVFNVLVGPLSSLLMSALPFRQFGQHRAWLLITAIPLALFFQLLWLKPTIPVSSLAIYYGSILILFNWFYGHNLCAYEAVMPLMNSDAIELQKVNTSRLFWGSIAGLVIVSLPSALVGVVQEATNRFLIMAGGCGAVLLLGTSMWVSSVTEAKFDPQEVDQLRTKTSWISNCKKLLKSKRVVVLLINTVLLWATIICMSSSLPSLSRLMFPSDNNTNETSFKSTFVIVASKLGMSLSQACMALFPRILKPELCVKLSVFLVMGSGTALGLGYKSINTTEPHLPADMIYLVILIMGIGVGGLFGSFEVMVPETILFSERSFNKLESEASTSTIVSDSLSGTQQTLTDTEAGVPSLAKLDFQETAVEESEDWENLVYAFVDAVRELSLAGSFYVSGELLSNEGVWGNQLILCAWIPVGIAVLVGVIHIWFPHIVFDENELKQ